MPAFLMEGDTPSFLSLKQSGLHVPGYPEYGGWGGRYAPVNLGRVHYADKGDRVIGVDNETYSNQHTPIWRWRDHFQNDFAARIQWTLTGNFWNASHPPVSIVNGTSGSDPIQLNVTSGQTLVFDASESYDPDHPGDTSALDFQWYQYYDLTTVEPVGTPAYCNIRPLSPPYGSNGTISHNEAGFRNITLGRQVAIEVPYFDIPLTHHIILQVTGASSDLPLRSYKRIILSASP